MSITGDLLDSATTVDNVTISNINNILAVKNYGLTQLQMANGAIYDRSIVSMAYSKLTASPQQLVDLIALTPTLNYTLGTNGTNIILRTPTNQLTAIGALPLAGGVMSGNINLSGRNVLNAGILQLLSTTNNTVLNLQHWGGGASYTLNLPASPPVISGSTPTNLVLGVGTSNICTWMNPETQVYKSFRIGSSNGNSTTDYITFGKTAGSAYTLNLPAAAPGSNNYLKWDSVTSSFIWASAGSGLTASNNITLSDNNISLNAALTGITSISGLSLPINPTDATSKQYVDSFAYVTPAALTSTLAGYLPLSGSTMTGNIGMNSNKVTGLGTPTLTGDAVPKGFFDTALGLYLTKSGGTMTGILTMGNNKITGLPLPTAVADAVNLQYVDAAITAVQDAVNATISNYLPLVGGALSGNLSMGTHLITNVLAPTSSTDAANKAYVDGFASSAGSNLAATVANYMPLAGGTHSGAVSMGNNAITNLPTPINSGDAANKAYVDLLASGFSIKPIVQCLMATTGGYTYSNGILGYGATLTKMNSTSVGLNIDSYILNVGDRILVNTTLTSAYNGVYQLTTNGISGQNTVLTRAADSDGTPLIELHPGATFFVQNGSIYGGYQYTQTSEIPTIVGTSSITYSAITAPSTVTAGSNIIVYQNEVELNPTVTGLNSLQFTSGSGYVNISKAIGGSNYNMVLPPSGSAGNQYLVYDNYGVASWTTDSSSGGTYTAGSNLTLSAGVFSVNPALTAINSVQLKEANSSGLVILSKASGGASYSLTLPAAAPGSNTYLKYDGADYSWATAGSSTSSLIACQFIHVSSVSNVAVTTNSFHSWNQMVGYSGNAATLTSPTQFTLLPGFTYKCSAMIEIPNAEIVINWYSVTGSVIFGSAGYALPSTAGRGNLAVGFITPSVTTIVSLQILYTPGTISYVEIYNKQPWAIIEVVSSNVAVSQFTGATPFLPGVAGFIPAPQAGTHNSYLRGDGNWVSANNGPTAAQYIYATSTVNITITSNNSGTIANWYFPFNSVSNVGYLVTQPTSSTFTLPIGYTYKCTFEVGQAPSQVTYGWYNITAQQNLGSWASLLVSDTQKNTAIAYITPVSTMTIGVAFSYGNGAVIPANYSVYGPVYTYATIEVLSNNNTISAFTGATSVTNGIVGYIPAPQAGTQNSYLRGDGNWISANNGPTAAIYLFALNTTNGYVTSFTNPIPFPVLQAQSGIGGVISYTAPHSTFTLQPGYTYKLTSGCNYASTAASFQWASNLNGAIVFIGVAGDTYLYSGCPAIAYTTPTIALPVSVMPVQQGLTTVVAVGLAFWMTIEVVSNNHLITAFTGATDVTNGIVGYIPAPPAGTQNSYLRGDGNWVSAANGPTAAQYMFAHVAGGTQTTSGSFTVPTYLIFPLANTLRIGTAVTQTNTTLFTILPGYSYKITSAVSQALSGNVEIAWLHIYVNNIAQGVQGKGVAVSNTDRHITDFTAVCYFTPTVSSTVQVGYGANSVTNIYSAWVTIEVVSNNNTITQFTGATGGSAGSIGYIPAPIAGDNTKFLCGSGSWATVPSNAYKSGEYMIGSNSATLVPLASNAYLTFSINNYWSGSSINQFSSSVYSLFPAYSYKITFTCDIYSGLTTTGAFAIARSPTNTLPSSITNWATQTIGNSYNSVTNAAAYYKPVCTAYITTTQTTYFGIIYTGSGNGANIANALLTIETH